MHGRQQPGCRGAAGRGLAHPLPWPGKLRIERAGATSPKTLNQEPRAEPQTDYHVDGWGIIFSASARLRGQRTGTGQQPALWGRGQVKRPHPARVWGSSG